MLALLLAAQAAAGATSWSVGPDPSAPGRVASARTDAAHRIAIYREGDAVRLRLELSAGFDTLREGTCPTLQVDDLAVAPPDSTCTQGGRWSIFELGQVRNRRVIAPLLFHIMNGTRLVYRYAGTAGYHEGSVPLTGSHAAVRAALGGVQVVPE